MYVCVRPLRQIFVSIHYVQSILYISCPPEAKGIDKNKAPNATDPDHLLLQGAAAPH